jgi:hypothetical protein
MAYLNGIVTDLNGIMADFNGIVTDLNVIKEDNEESVTFVYGIVIVKWLDLNSDDSDLVPERLMGMLSSPSR